MDSFGFSTYMIMSSANRTVLFLPSQSVYLLFLLIAVGSTSSMMLEGVMRGLLCLVFGLSGKTSSFYEV